MHSRSHTIANDITLYDKHNHIHMCRYSPQCSLFWNNDVVNSVPPKYIRAPENLYKINTIILNR